MNYCGVHFINVWLSKKKFWSSGGRKNNAQFSCTFVGDYTQNTKNNWIKHTFYTQNEPQRNWLGVVGSPQFTKPGLREEENKIDLVVDHTFLMRWHGSGDGSQGRALFFEVLQAWVAEIKQIENENLIKVASNSHYPQKIMEL